MVQNAKHKFLVCSFAITVLTVGLLIGAIVTPNWVMYSGQPTTSQASTQGLFKGCDTKGCTSNNFDVNGHGVIDAGCKQDGGQVQDRFNVTAGTLLAAAALTALVCLVQLVHIFRIAKISERGNMWLFWILMAAFASSLTGVCIFGGTVNSWWNCGSTFCQSFANTSTGCGVGYAYIFTIIGCGVILLCAVGVITYTKFPHVMFPSNDVVLLMVLGEIFAVTFIGIGVASPEWLVVVYNYASVGLFQRCDAWNCAGSNYDASMTTRTNCVVAGSSVTSRYSAAAALLIISAVINAVLAILFCVGWLKISTKLFLTNTKKRITMTFIGLSFLLQTVGLIIASNVISSYYFCGIGYCELYPGFCRYGIGFGLCLASVCLTSVLFLLHLFEFNDWCCFEERFASGRQSFSVWKVLRGTKEGDDDGDEMHQPEGGNAKGKGAPTAAAKSDKSIVGAGGVQLPAGQWDYDTVSGFYWSEELYLFYDPSTQQFYDPNKDEWFAQDRRTAGLTTPRSQFTDVVKPEGSRAGSFERSRVSPNNNSQLSREQLDMVRVNSPRRHTGGGGTPNKR